MPVLILLLALAVLVPILSRKPRRTEGLLIAYLLPCLAFFAYVTWHNKAADISPSGVNVNSASAAEIAQKTGVPIDIADELVQKRKLIGSYTSILAIPTLGHASYADRADIKRLAERKDWKTLRQIAETGVIPKSARPGLVGGVVRSLKAGETTATGFYPFLDLRVRANQAIPEPEIDLQRSLKANLINFLGDEAVVERIIQFRTTEWRPYPGEILRISDIPAVPKAMIFLRTKEEAFGLYWATILALIAAVFLLHLYLRKRKSAADQFLLPLVGSLGILAVIMLFSASSPLRSASAVPGLPLLLGRAQPKYIGQAMAVLLGLAMLPFAYRGIKFIQKSATQEIIALAAVAPLAANVFARWGTGAIPSIILCGAMLAGILYWLDRKGMARYVVIGTLIVATLAAGRILVGRSGYAPFIEFAKIALIVFTARLCADHDFFFGRKLKTLPSSVVIQFMSIWTVALILTLLARDMGVLLLLWMPCVLLIGFAFSRREVLAGVVFLLIGGKIVQLLALGPFQDRVAMWLNPWSYEPSGIYPFSGQMAQAFHRIASVPSVIAGMGLGKGTPADIATDTQDVVLPLYFEQMGFVGIALIVIILLIIIHRMFRISLSSRERFPHWLGLGFASAFGVQTVYILGANFGAWPLTGVTLAPLAFGKAACLSAFVMIWTVLGVSESTDSCAAGHVPKKRIQTVRWVFAGMILLSFLAVGKAFKVGVIDRDANALAHYGSYGARNSRIAESLNALPGGQILARASSSSYNTTKVLARNSEQQSGREYTLGPSVWSVVGVASPYGVTGGESDWRNRLTGAYSLIQDGSIVSESQNVIEMALLYQWRGAHHPLWPAHSKWDDAITPHNVQTTIIASVQLEAYRKLSDYLSGSLFRNGLRPRKGAILIVDVRTGEYLAKVQFPSIDPNALTSGWMAWDNFATDPSGYLDPNGNMIDLVENTDRALGSTAKLNTIMALLSDRQGTKKFLCAPGVRVNGHVIHDFGAASHGWVDAEKIIKYSCNRGAAQAAKAVGSQKLLSLYREKLRYRLLHMSNPDKDFGDNYDKIAFGQAISANLKELMTTICAIARGGEAIELHVLRKRSEDIERWRVCGKDTAALMKKYMIAAAQPGGTAYSVYEGKVAWPSKTGSAEVHSAKKTDSWFVGFAPAANPRVAFVLWVEEDGTGSNMAKQLGLKPLIDHALSATANK